MTQRKRLAVARFWYEGNAFACSRPAARISSAANGSAARRAWTPRAARPPSWRLSRISRTAARTGGPRFALRLGPAGRPRAAAVFPGIRGRGAGRFTRPALGRHLPEPAWRLHHRRGRQSGIELAARHTRRASARSDRRQLRPARQYPAGLAAAAVVQRQLPDLSAHRHARDGRALPGAADRHRRGRDPSRRRVPQWRRVAAKRQHAHRRRAHGGSAAGARPHGRPAA